MLLVIQLIQLSLCSLAVQVRVHAAHLNVPFPLRIQSVGMNRSVLSRACAMESLPNAPPQHPKKTSQPATEIPKSALVGQVHLTSLTIQLFIKNNNKGDKGIIYFPSFSQSCSGSICQKYGLDVCTCASEEGKDETELCHVCCMQKGE